MLHYLVTIKQQKELQPLKEKFQLDKYIFWLTLLLYFICKYYLIFMAISSLTHDCLIYEHTGIFQLSFWLLDSSLMSLTSENTLCMVSILWNLLSCIMTQPMSNVDKYLLRLERNEYCMFVKCTVL